MNLEAQKEQGAGFMTRLLKGKQEEVSDDDDAGKTRESGDEDDEAPVPVKSPEELAKQKQEDEAKLKLLSDIVVSPGDYQVQVHVIEARDLKGENADTTSNPVVTVQCFDQKQHTRTAYSCNSCVFDEVLIFNMKALDREQVSCSHTGILAHCKSTARPSPNLPYRYTCTFLNYLA